MTSELIGVAVSVDLAIAWLATSMVLLPLGAFALAGLAEIVGAGWRDEVLAAVSRALFTLTTIAGLTAAALFGLEGGRPVHHVFGRWFSADGAGAHQAYEVGVLVDATSLTYLVLTSLLAGTVGAFSLRYLEGEEGAGRFFRAMMLFTAGLSLVVVAESLGLLFVGWELVGVSSALLIAFYRHREGPVRHALLAFAIYRICDAALLASLVVLHHASGTTSLPAAFEAPLSPTVAALFGGLVLFASLGKSAQLPFSGWLPRAMEGPTPSSAIFYGALSVHAGAYLLLRTAPLWEGSTPLRVTIVMIGALTALLGTLTGRAQTDVKSGLAYAASAQVGLIFVEIGLGLHTLALVHVVGHALVRTLELLRAPSLLQDVQRLEAELGRALPRAGARYERVVPRRIRTWLYRFALERAFLDTLASRLIAALRRATRALDAFDRRVVGAATSRASTPGRGVGASAGVAHGSTSEPPPAATKREGVTMKRGGEGAEADWPETVEGRR
ncbi:MAG: proton-conducting membrane transporter [Myxococcales bacterium]|nr:proton-conducting membrane transporter [Myxococcales bacterium]